MGKLLGIIALSILVAFTGIMTALAVVSKGALIYFFEPNLIVLLCEVVAGSFAVIWGLHMILLLSLGNIKI